MSSMTRRLSLALMAALVLTACNKGGASTGGGDEMSLGNPNAKVTVIEYASASCPHCARWDMEVWPQFKKKYVDSGQVHYVFREFLTEPVQLAAAGFLLARCAGKDKYFPVLDAVFRSQAEWQTGNPRDSLLRIAQTVGLNEEQFNACVSNEKSLKALNDRVEKFEKQDKIQGTPTFIINGKKYEQGEMSMADLDAAIQPLLKK